tara:strand:+ start:835 stop:1119 length:285 start_codon:yes stop_codon:yes gene_type:complete
MENIKCITFDKQAQDNLPQKIKDKMKENQDKAKKELETKGLNIPVVSDMFVYIVETSKGVAHSYLQTYDKAQEEVKRLQPRFKKPMQIDIQKVY